MHDRDTKFTASIDDARKASGVKMLNPAYRSTNSRAFVERFIEALQPERLDDFLVFGDKHRNYLVSEMAAHYREVETTNHHETANSLSVQGDTRRWNVTVRAGLVPESKSVAPAHTHAASRCGHDTPQQIRLGSIAIQPAIESGSLLICGGLCTVCKFLSTIARRIEANATKRTK